MLKQTKIYQSGNASGMHNPIAHIAIHSPRGKPREVPAQK